MAICEHGIVAPTEQQVARLEDLNDLKHYYIGGKLPPDLERERSRLWDTVHACNTCCTRP